MVTHDPVLAEMATRNIHILDGQVSKDSSVSQLQQAATA